jgi:hypothetical protein
MLSIYGTSNALRLSYDASNYNTFSTASDGTLNVTSSATTEAQVIVGNSTAQDTSIAFNSDTNDFYAGVDDATDSFMIGSGFVVGTTPYVTIDATGDFGIGDTTPSYKLEVNTDISTNYVAQFFNDGNNADRYGIQIQGGADDASGTTYYINALDGDGGQIGYIANTSGTFALTDVSDIRTKTNVTTAEMNATSILSGLRVVNFNRISNPDGPQITGFIAQEVQEIYPNAVTEGPTGLLGISKDAFIPVLVKAFQEETIRLASAEAKLETIELKTDQNITTLSGLQASVDTQLTVAGTELTALTAKDVAHDAQFVTDDTRLTALDTLTTQMTLDINTQASKTALLETQMQTLTEQLSTLTDFYATFDLGNLVAKDVLGNVDLLDGKLKAAILETGALTIEVVDAEAPTIGTVEVLPVAIDTDNDGNDDFTGLSMTDPEVVARDGQFVQVMTKAMIPMVNGSRIFTTWKGNPNGFSWIEKTKDANDDYVGFKIRLSAPITTPTKVDWLLVEQKDNLSSITP